MDLISKLAMYRLFAMILDKRVGIAAFSQSARGLLEQINANDKQRYKRKVQRLFGFGAATKPKNLRIYQRMVLLIEHRLRMAAAEQLSRSIDDQQGSP